MSRSVDLFVRHARQLLTLDGPLPDPEHPDDPRPLGVIPDGAVACAKGKIVALGPTDTVERTIDLAPDALVLDARDGLVAPGLIDSHTHALFVGHRADEFAARLAGTSYAEIAARGGGIARTVRALRAADDQTLVTALEARLARMRAFGVTTVEVKTGYGLDTSSELRSLRVIRAVRDRGPSRVVTTFLPLHAVDPDLRSFPDGRARFLSRVLNETLPAALALHPDFVDAYLDTTGFSVMEARPVLERARTAGLGIRLHVGQFADVGGAELAAELGAASADHLEHVSDQGLRALSSSGVVAILLPGATFSLGQPWPDARRIRAHGVEIALATDCNPGTSYTENLPLMTTFAVRQMGLSIVEAWWAITRAAARSLRRPELGRLTVGGVADLCILDLPCWEALPYVFGSPLARVTVIAGRVVHSTGSVPSTLPATSSGPR